MCESRLGQYIWLFVNERQSNWYDLLALAKFQHNNHVHMSTRQPPFLLDTGRLPQMGFEPCQRPSKLESVNEFSTRMSLAVEEAKSVPRKARDEWLNTAIGDAPRPQPSSWES